MPVAMSSARQPTSDPSSKRQHAGRPFDPDALDFLRRENFHAKTPRLRDRAPRQVRAAQAHGKTEIIFDARTSPGLPAGRFAFDQQRVQAVRRAINRRRQSRRPRADHDQIVKRKFRLGFQSQLARDLRDGRVAQERAVGKHHQRQRRSSALRWC